MANTDKAGKSPKQQPAQGSTSAAGVTLPNGDNVSSEGLADNVFKIAGAVGVVALLASLGLGVSAGDDLAQFSFSYLVAYAFVLALGLGCLFWVTLQHLVNAHWSVVVRRLGELFAANMPLLALLSLPILIPIVMGNHALYVWTDHAKVEASHLLHGKAGYLNVGFFLGRMVFYFVFWSALSRFWLKRSVAQDLKPEAGVTRRWQGIAAPSMILVALTLTFSAIDLLMSLDAAWFSTMFGVYFFSGAFMSANCLLALAAMWLQGRGRLVKSVSVHHLHDLGKMTFGFVVFWAYIAFSQFMLIWYANIPEETAWYKVRFEGDWKYVAIFLLVGHFIVPFLGMMSKHVKRRRGALTAWTLWLLIMQYVDLYYLVQPTRLARVLEEAPAGEAVNATLPFHLLDLTCLLALVALFIAGAAFNARKKNLVPVNDPRLEKSLAFTNL